MRVNILSLLLVGVFLCACDSNQITVTSIFSIPQEISKDTPVYFSDQVVGSITGVKETLDGTVIELVLDKEKALSINSNAAVLVNRLKQGSPLEIYNRSGLEQQPLVSGQKIQGLNSVVELGAWMVGDAIQVGVKSVSQYVDAFQNYLQSEQFQQDKKVVQEQIKGVAQTTQQAFESVGDDVDEALQELSHAEEAAAQSMQQLEGELSPVVSDLSSSSQKVIEQLDELLKKLELPSLQEQHSGTDFLTALLATLEKLNLAIEGQEKKNKEQN